MKILISICFLFIGSINSAKCQSKTNKDSLFSAIQTMREDSLKVDQLYIYGEFFEDEFPDTAAHYFKKAKALAQKINYKKGEAAFSSRYIVILNNRGAFREALNVAEEALEIYKVMGTNRDLAVAYLNVGNEWQYLSDFAQATDYYLIAKKWADEVQDKKLQRVSNNNLASVFIELQQYEKGIQYAETALGIARELKNDYAIASSMYNIANALMHQKQHDKALAIYKQIEQIGIETSDDILQLDGWLGTADAQSAMKNDALAQQFYNKVIQFSKEKNTPEYEMYACMGMIDVQVRQKNFALGESFVKRGIELAQQQGSKLELKDLYLKASILYEEKGNTKLALNFRKDFELLNDSIVGEKSRALVSNLEARYEFEKKEATIQQLHAENEVKTLTIGRKNLYNYVLIGSALTLLIILLLSYRTYKQKQLLQQQQISELETQQKLTATEAVLKGEEQERSRLAKDLHDGLGGMLSGIKYSFNAMKGNLILTPETAQAFERSMDLLDSSIKEMRRVAHNMMPEALVKFGLETALKDFCNDINQTGALQLSYQSIGFDQQENIEQTKAITIYRIVQELVNNSIKHGAASKVLVQLSKEANKILLTVEDDGIGFDSATLKQARGMGWSNIQNRVEFLKGQVDVDSKIGTGTSVHIEITV
jgi:signal transduction histidine kinase